MIVSLLIVITIILGGIFYIIVKYVAMPEEDRKLEKEIIKMRAQWEADHKK